MNPIPERDTIQGRPARRRTRFRDGKPPLNIGVAPTIRLPDGGDPLDVDPTWIPGRPAPAMTRGRFPRPVAPRPTRLPMSTRPEVRSLVPFFPRSTALVAPFGADTTVRRRLRRRSVLILAASCICFVLTFYTPLAAIPAAACGALAIAEIRIAWSRLSPRTHAMAAASLALSAAAVVTQAVGWMRDGATAWPSG